MAVDSAPPGTAFRRVEELVRARVSAAWVAGIALGLYAFATQVVNARFAILEPDDNGVLFTTVTYLLHGQIPISDFYQPYGIAMGLPGILPHLLGYDGAFALRLTYGLFPALVTCLVTVFVWRRCGWKLGLLVGVVSLSSTVARYS